MRFLIDEVFPPDTSRLLVSRGHDAVHVRDRGVDARPDPEVAAEARRDGRVLMTENVKDFATERDIVIVCVLKARLRRRGMAEHLAQLLDEWAHSNPNSYQGMHWP